MVRGDYIRVIGFRERENELELRMEAGFACMMVEPLEGGHITRSVSFGYGGY